MSISLQNTEELCRTLFEETSDGIFISDAQGHLLEINPQGCALLGYSRQELRQLSWPDLLRTENAVQELLTWEEGNKDQPAWIEGHMRGKEGFWLTVEIRLRRLAEGHLMAFVRDIGLYKRAVEIQIDHELLVNQSRDILLVVRQADGQILEANASATKLYGYSRQELLTLSIHDLRASETQVMTEAQMAEANVHGLLFETIHRRKDGTSFPVEVSSQGGIIHGTPTLISIIRDITERKQAEKALLTSENNYRLLSEYNRQLNDISISFNEAANTETLWRTIAETYRRLTGAVGAAVFQYEPPARTIRLVAAALDENHLNRIEAVLGVSLFEMRIIVPDEMIPLMISQGIHKTADLAALAFGQIPAETADKLLATLGAAQGIVMTLSYGAKLLGTTVAFMAQEQPDVFDHGLNTFAHMAGLALTRKKAEEALQESEQHFRALIENSADVIALLNAEGAILYESSAVTRILGYQPEDMLGHNAFEFLHPDDQVIAVELFGQIMQQPQQPITGQFRYGHKDGTWHWVEVVGANQLNNPGIQAIVVNYSDITERKQAEEAQAKLEERLRQAQKMESIGLLAGGVAHDFNNLLTVILGYSELIQTKLSPHDPLFDTVEQIRQAGKRAESLTRQLLAFSRKQMLIPVILDLNDLVINLRKILGRLIGENVTLVTMLQPGLWNVTADPSQMEQVIINLAINARDAMPTGGRLTLETRNILPQECLVQPQFELPVGPYVMLRMMDTGYGMDETTLANIFEPFFTTKEQGKGTGLGLATVYGIVKQSGGEITADSRPGQGAVFTLYLPAHEITSLNPTLPPLELATRQGHETILLVEDEKMVRDLVWMMLQNYGYTLLEANHGYQALALAQQQEKPIDLLVTDVIMPQMNGRELAERLKALHPQIKVLFISGYTDDEVIHHGLLAAEVEFLSKPFSPDALAAKVRELLDK